MKLERCFASSAPGRAAGLWLAGWLIACSGGDPASPGQGGSAGMAGGMNAPSAGAAGSAAAMAGSASSPPGGAATAGAGTAGGGASAGGVEATAGASPSGGADTSGGSNAAALSVTPSEGLWTGVRHYADAGAIPSNRTNGPAQGPEKVFTVHNAANVPVELAISVTGADAARFELTAPSEPKLSLAAGADAQVHLRLVTDNALLGPAPAQAAGATVLNASLELAGAGQKLSLRNYALVLTYAELEPTFGQILRAFPAWTTKLPSWLPDNANPNPGSPLPGVVAGTDEVVARSFQRLDASQPVTLRPIARFSPAGQVPFGWYEPGKLAGRTAIATMAQEKDPNTNDKARLLEPPLASGKDDFEPSVATFGIWMLPAGVGLLTSNDADGFDGQHRVRAWTLRDAAGAVLPGSFLIGGEEANNGDYQDYVFVLTNVKPGP